MNTVNVELFGKDPKIVKALSIARNVSVTKAPVLITGEAGLGKKTLGHFIHDSSTRANQQLMVVDCSAEGKEVENKILGYRDEETGRFNRGALEVANGGTVIFANIDGLEDEFQKRFHKILTELSDYDIDVRIVATTTKNLSKLVGAGRFYRGLYTFISPNTINLTPLRERVGDLEMIARHYITELSSEEVTLNDNALNKILNHYWTHNVQELKAVIESSVANLQDGVLGEEALEIGEKRAVSMISEEDSEGIRLMSLKEAERLLIKKALIHTSENRTQAAKILGVSIRTLRNKINEYRNSGNAYFVNLR
ncbi:sigma 54-interacting transcriptional regulator [Halobacteriovorax sp. GB3]|uniref:sigma-54-dependent transcriptional regulator n=1 Tax=Halobacteriovorax sp. GB3 TaxID=2719615 RepID=UPI00235F4729|nr:sigma 54-interacting transcriptional regulator [Halobacteriovorax sp. GB3]MDD0852642.1 sigma 54-interacting transcriptional regulator [Halobacteriovorax sp. GB3]